MTPRRCIPLAVAGLLAAGPAVAAAWAELSDAISAQAEEIAWSPAPPALPAGAEIAVLEGDLTKEEPHTFRLRLPDGYAVAPHSHPLREHITVLQGTLMMGEGDTVDEAAMSPLAAGAFYVLPTGETHYVRASGETVLQLHGIGPWGIDYVDAEDDPRAAN